MHIFSYIELTRLNRPTGIWLLLFPCWWAITLASAPNLPDIKLLALFAIGAISMRSAGCIINDIIDRKIDAQVLRTKNRPLASGKLSIKSALFTLSIALLIGAITLFFLPLTVTYSSIIFFIPVIIYPLMKRYISYPQAVLALTFNAGAIVGWTAVTQTYPPITAYILYISCIFWTLAYDTIYAHQDKIYDQKIGVKSSALSLGDNTKKYLYIFYSLMLIALAATYFITFNLSIYFFMLLIAAAHLFWQIYTVDLDNSTDCMNKFKSNTITGWIIFISLISAATSL